MAARFSILPRRLILIIASVLLTVLVVHLAGVAMVRYFVEKQLHPALPRGTYIGDVHLNLFSGALEIEDFELRNDAQRRMRFKRLTVDVSPWRLLTGKVHVEHASLHQAYVLVERRADGSIDLGLPSFGDTADAPPADAAPPDVVIAGIDLGRLMIDYRDGDLESEIYIDKAKVGTYSSRAEQQRLAVEWQLHWDGREIVGDAELALRGAQLDVSGTLRTELIDLARAESLARLPPAIDGAFDYDGRFEWTDGALALRGDISAPRLAYTIAGRTIELAGVALPGIALDLDPGPTLQLEARIADGSRLASWKTAFEGQTVRGDALTIAGVIGYDEDANTADLEQVVMAAETLQWTDAGRRVDLTGLAVDGRSQQRLSGETPFPALNANLAAATVAYSDDAAGVALETAGLRVDDLAISQPDETGLRRLGGRLQLAASRVDQAGSVLGWESLEATLGGELGVERLNVVTDAGLSGISIDTPQLAHGPLRVARLDANRLALGSETSFAGLRVDGLVLPGAPADTTLRIDSIQVAASSYSAADGVRVGDVNIDGLRTGVLRDQGGQWRHVSAGGGAQVGATHQGQGGAGNAADTPAWQLAGVRLGGDSAITFADALNPGMQPIRYDVRNIEIGALSSRAPDRDTPFSVALAPDEFSEFVIDGVVRPLAARLYLKANGHLHGFGLNSVNGLVADDLGHRFIEGQLDNDFTITIDSDRLDMGNALSLAGLLVEPIEGKDGPPLSTAVALLEDRDGNIKLEVPVAGDLTDPDFRVLGALNPIIMKAVAGTAALAIQPLGSVLLVGSLLANQALKVTFEPAVFDAGSTDLNPAARKYLGLLGAKLAEKPKLAVRVCGVVVDAERKKDKQGKYADEAEDVLAVAQRRADAARDYLAANGAGPKQLRRCRPSFDAKADAQPRVDIRF